MQQAVTSSRPVFAAIPGDRNIADDVQGLLRTGARDVQESPLLVDVLFIIDNGDITMYRIALHVSTRPDWTDDLPFVAMR